VPEHSNFVKLRVGPSKLSCQTRLHADASVGSDREGNCACSPIAQWHRARIDRLSVTSPRTKAASDGHLVADLRHRIVVRGNLSIRSPFGQLMSVTGDVMRIGTRGPAGGIPASGSSSRTPAE